LKHGKLTLVDVINAMGNAATQDLRGVADLPYALRIIGAVHGNAALAGAVSELREWVATGAHRINRVHPGASGEYQQGAAVQLIDAWWPLWVNAEFGRLLGPSLLGGVESVFTIDNPPNSPPEDGSTHVGSSWDVGFYGIVQEDLKSVLAGHVVRGGLNRIFCGDGSLAGCRAALISSLEAAMAVPADRVYPGDSFCKAGDQMCADAIDFRAIGVISVPLMEWSNRPTFQQADMITGHMG